MVGHAGEGGLQNGAAPSPVTLSCASVCAPRWGLQWDLPGKPAGSGGSGGGCGGAPQDGAGMAELVTVPGPTAASVAPWLVTAEDADRACSIYPGEISRNLLSLPRLACPSVLTASFIASRPVKNEHIKGKAPFWC